MRTITAIAVAALTTVAFSGDATAATKPTITQEQLYRVYTGPFSGRLLGVDVGISRTDHKTPRGVRVCLQHRAPRSTAVTTVGCGMVDVISYHFFKFAQARRPVAGERWRVFHPATSVLARYYGPWSVGNMT